MKLPCAPVILLAACATTPPPSPVAPQPPPVVAVAPPEPQAIVEPTPPPPPEPPKSLFDRLGGQAAIDAVVHEFVSRTTTDPRIANRFFNTDPVHLEKMLAELVCEASGGPCKYSGKDMTSAHAGMDLVHDEFVALAENLVAALDTFHVPEKEKSEILGAIGPLEPQVVVDPSRLHPIDAAKLEAVGKLAESIRDPKAKELLAAAILAGQRGQRSYAEQLFACAEMIAGAKSLAKVAGTFREGAPPVVTTPLKKLPDTTRQPDRVGASDDDAPVAAKTATAVLRGTLATNGKLGVVMLTPKDGSGAKRVPKQRVIEQREKIFAPHVMAIPVGSTVSFPNFDPIYHNVFSVSKPAAFDLGMYKNGELREWKFDKPGIVRLGCNIHASMAAYIVVVDAPHYVVVDDKGSFAFKHLKPGAYTMRAWSEGSGEPKVSTITVKAGENEQTIELDGGAPDPSLDKFGTPRTSAR